jgi:membrane associated rhomboid family serine protease
MLTAEAGLMLGARAKEFIHVTARERAALRNRHSEFGARGDGNDGAPDLRDEHSEMFDPALARTLDDVARRCAEAVRPLGRPRQRAHVTFALIAVNVAVAVLATGLHDSTATELVRAGALFRPAVEAGEWWRALSAIFLHANAGHLAVNMLGLFIAGRFCEDAFGSLRYFVIYVGAGLAGAAASTFVTVRSGLSVGASGAIMGLLGGAIVVLVLRRGIWPEVWRRTLLWYLVLLAAVQIYIDFQLPVIDNAAHVGGMLGGAAMTLLVAPGGLLGRSLLARALLVALAATAIGAFAWTAVKVSRTSLDDTFARLPTKTVSVAGERLRVPTYWEYDEDHDVVVDPYLALQLPPSPVPPDNAELRRVLERIAKSARSP